MTESPSLRIRIAFNVVLGYWFGAFHFAPSAWDATKDALGFGAAYAIASLVWGIISRRGAKRLTVKP